MGHGTISRNLGRKAEPGGLPEEDKGKMRKKKNENENKN